MKALAFLLALAACGTFRAHPIAASMTANATLIVGAGVCTVECGAGAARGISEGVLIGELALSSLGALAAVELIAAYAEQSK